MSEITTKIQQTKQGAFRLTELSLISKQIPNSFDGYKIVQLTDLHFGPLTPISHISSCFSLAMRQEPDLIVLTGDNIQNSAFNVRHHLATNIDPKVFHWSSYRRDVRRLTKELATVFQKLDAPDGLIGVLGNHEYTEGVGTVIRLLDPRIRWLRNERLFINRNKHSLQISGLEDLTRGKPNLEQTLNHPPSKLEPFLNILLSHNPDITIKDRNNNLSEVDLILSGHTHGGQICIPFWGPIVTRTKQKKHVAGLSQHTTGAHVYVSHGIGYGGLPIRLFCPPEIVVISLSRK